MHDATQQLWTRVAGLRFRLCDSVVVDALHYRGREAYLLRSAFDRRRFRLGGELYRLLARLDGRLTLNEACGLRGEDTEPCASKRREIVTALFQLQEAGLLVADVAPDVETLVALQRRRRRRKWLGGALRLLSPRFALVDPDRFLERSFPKLAWLFRPVFLLAWLSIALFAGFRAANHWDALTLYGAQRLDDPRQWVLLICLYPLMKGLHELGHCYAVKAGGAAVRELGIMLLVFVPVPYVDASAASSFRDKRRRMLVGAAGLMMEVFVASLGLFVWLAVDDGPTRDVAYATMLIGGVSTLLFNGNPLLRFDGYYVLSDALEIPDLASRASRYYGYLSRRYLFGLRDEKSPCLSSGERRWFIGYGAAATLYRIGIAVGIAFFLFSTVPVLGALLAALLLVSQLLIPMGRQLHYLLTSPALCGKRTRALAVVGGSLCALGIVSSSLPVPSSTHVDGIVLLPDRAIVRAGVDGFLERQWTSDGTRTERGDVLVELISPELGSAIQVSRARVRELEARRDLLDFGERGAREVHGERLAESRAEFEQLLEREAALTVHSPTDGVFHTVFGEGGVGRFVRKGDMLGYVADRTDTVIRVVATQQKAARIRAGVRRVDVRLADRGSPTLPGRLLGEVPLASDTLPSAALGSRAGGAIAVDARDEHGVAALQGVFAFDVAVPSDHLGRYVGSRASLRLRHTAEPLLPRWHAALRERLIEKIGW